MAMVIKKKPAAPIQVAAAAPAVKAPPVITAAMASKLKIAAKMVPVPKPAPVAQPDPAPWEPEPTGDVDETLQIEGEVGHGTTSKQYKDGTIVDTTEQFETDKIAGPVAHVHVSIGLTRNLGNYESVKISVGVTLPCAPTADDIDETYNEAKGWCDARIEQINEEVTAELGTA